MTNWFWTLGGTNLVDGRMIGKPKPDGVGVLSWNGGPATGNGLVSVSIGQINATFHTNAGFSISQTATSFKNFIDSNFNSGNFKFIFVNQSSSNKILIAGNVLGDSLQELNININSQDSTQPLIIQPNFFLTVKNLTFSDTLGGYENVLYFDICIQHTNFAKSGPFEFAFGEYHFTFNPAVANGGILSYTIVSNSTTFTNPNAVPRNPTINGNQLNLERNIELGAGNGPIVSTSFPETRVVTMRLATTASSFAMDSLNLLWREGTIIPFTKVSAYIGLDSTDISNSGFFKTDTTLSTVLPVELINFTSLVDRNNITLNWSTTKEINNAGFDIERNLTSSINWIKVGYLPGKGTTNETKIYTFSERINTGKYNYRLKQIDFNGNYEYFNLTNEVEVGVPTVYFISQNYPNPFNPTTKINYDIPFDGKVSIKLFDLAGREIVTLVNNVQSAGYYTIDFNGSNLASGVYFYEMSTDANGQKFVATKKMVILK